MGKVEIPARVISICDLCGAENKYLQKCVVCNKEYCLMCAGIGQNPYRQNICTVCIKRDDVIKIIDAGLLGYRKAKDNQLKKLKGLA